ncbi:unnamed protein product [Strongylus vulgaris]|uniref:Uncharacterized protein n=1 Tax=Strongylus vulgaris TaxID=40348 RepID=A0A3P7J9S7_STRVU|nr:unnamed protein product [Strongylus vulgaris]
MPVAFQQAGFWVTDEGQPQPYTIEGGNKKEKEIENDERRFTLDYGGMAEQAFASKHSSNLRIFAKPFNTLSFGRGTKSPFVELHELLMIIEWLKLSIESLLTDVARHGAFHYLLLPAERDIEYQPIL